MKMKLLNTALLATMLMTVLSCKKDAASNSDGDSYLKIKKNGAWTTYQAIGELGPDLANNAKTDFGVTAVSEDQKERFDLTIQIDGNNFTTGTYDSHSSSYWIDMSYWLFDASGMEQNYYDITSIDGQPDSRYTVVVTAITSTHLKGTFTGNYLTDDMTNDDPEAIPITEGEFYVKRAR